MKLFFPVLLRNHCHTSLCKSEAHGRMVWFTYIVVVQSLSCVWLFATPWTAAHQASLSFTVSWSLLRLVSTESMMPSNHVILCCPLLLLPSLFPSIHIRWPNYWSFNFSISPSSESSGLISFRIDWFDLAVQGTLKGLLQHNLVQLSHPYMTTGKIIALIIAFVGKVMSLPFNTLSRFAIAFLPRSKCLLISWWQWFWKPRK